MFRRVVCLTLLAVAWAHDLDVVYDKGVVPEAAAAQFVAMDPSQFEIVSQGPESRFLCQIPEIPVMETKVNKTMAPDLLRRAVEVVQKSFQKDSCVFEINWHNAYWTYGYCLGDKIVQYNQDLDAWHKTGAYKVGEHDTIYTLGRFKNAAKYAEDALYNQSPGNSRLDPNDFHLHNSQFHLFVESDHIDADSPTLFIAHQLDDGSICDLTKEPRLIDVLYQCGEGRHPKIVDLVEVQICRYQMVVSVPGLCELPEFSPNSDKDAIPITCKRIDSLEFSDTIISADQFEDFAYPIKFQGFPPRGTKVNMHDFFIDSMGQGFFYGYGQGRGKYGRRHVIFHSSPAETLEGDFVNVFRKSLSRKLPLPVQFSSQLGPALLPLKWSDKFVVWYEIYNMGGALEAVVKVSNTVDDEDVSSQEDLFWYHWIDPNTMTDGDGDAIDPPKFSAGHYNFEYFDRQDLQWGNFQIKPPADDKEPEIDIDDHYDNIAAELKLDVSDLKKVLEGNDLHLARKPRNHPNDNKDERWLQYDADHLDELLSDAGMYDEDHPHTNYDSRFADSFDPADVEYVYYGSDDEIISVDEDDIVGANKEMYQDDEDSWLDEYDEL